MQNRLSISIKNVEIWLIGIGGTLIAINLNLVSRVNHPTNFYVYILFLTTLYLLLKEKRHQLNLESSILSSITGTLLIGLVFVYSFFQINIGFLFLFPPLLSGFGTALLASGYRGLKQYKRELWLLGFLTIRNFMIMNKLDLTIVTAKFSTVILWYTGFKVNRSGVMIHLPTGSVEVYSACSGIDLIIDLLSLAVLFIYLFNLSWQQKIMIPIVAACLGFVVNGFRVALMAILVAQGDKEAFEYWHLGDGSLIFSIVASLFLCCFCWFLLSRNENESKNSINYSK
ncbi:exosortase [Nostoc piscinale CENA21]|uniref:Exosortase n=1 Tax=Nostoc piscinale CENA21 TaxID=224013 RepID=A0A0M4T145_9NOSO|nr:cyanoexosortase A [Nostoc piscinale]ALF55859.1 exosortase [Nostoc piscinale CENA21]